MKLSDARLLKAPNKLVLINAKVQSVFQAMNSMVSLTPVQGDVTFKDSEFQYLHTCGSLVKNTLSNLGKPHIQDYIFTQFLSQAQVDKITQVWAYQDLLNPSPL